MTEPRPASLRYGSTAGRWVIAAAVIGSGMALMDTTVVNIALPAISRSLHTGVGALQWVVGAYALTLASFTLVGGALGDRYGQRRVFRVGVVWFAAASAACSLAPDAGLLIAARAAQGVGGALLTPASLALLQASFTAEDRARAIGAWTGLAGLASAAGPMVGGYLISVASWRWVFYVNLPLAAAALLITARHVPESGDRASGERPDALGSALAVLTLTGLVYGLIEGPNVGWGTPLVVGAFVVAALGGPTLIVVERRTAAPMLELDMFRIRQFSAVNAVTFIVYGALGGVLFLAPLTLQVVDRYSALEAGLAVVPLTAIVLLGSPWSARMAAERGPRRQLIAGPIVIGAAMMLLLLAPGHRDYLVGVLPAVLVFGAGLALTVAPLTATALGSAPPEHAGMASAVNNVVGRTGGLIAVALLPALAGLTGTLTRTRLAHGFRVAMLITAAACVAGGVLAAFTISDDIRPPDALGSQTEVVAEEAQTPLGPSATGADD